MADETKQPLPADDYDTPWKDALEHHFPEFLAFYFPDAHAGIDWSRGYQFLDKELAQVTKDAELGKRYVDKLVAVHRHDGAEDWVYIHIEIQGGHDSAFAKRMFVYNYRLFERYDRPVASLAVLADDSPDWRPSTYGYELFGCRHFLEYPLVKLIDHAARLDALLEDPNPFAIVTAAHLLTRQTRGDAERRYAAKWRLTRLLYERDWDRQRIIDLYFVIDWMMYLPPGLQDKLWQEISTLERNKTMPYVSSVERIGYQRGRREEAGALVCRLLKRRFGPLPQDFEDRIATLPLERIESLIEDQVDFSALANLDTWLQRH
ncbi:DUF4351 domain-containing protein [uncultured Thiodictyon sp.]|jgi:hypothetical protein|uniref:DUF4351 domain-containing protein n=1 Tax=uncultured Thiodictyon sp. TaxID=1846217 RepID=UPI0025F8A865|nr:DUF4351 domain-containing protein [uncultured Thiodictyon sp.]